MAIRHSNETITHGAVPDPKAESIDPQLDVRLARELRSLLKSELEAPDDTAVALGARSLSDIFAEKVPRERLSIDDARAVESIEVGGFTAWPIFITYAGGSRDPYAPIYNNSQMEESLSNFYTPGRSTVRGAIGEAIRNIGQHGHDLHAVGYHQCLFAPAAVLVKEFSVGKGDGPDSRVLMAVVTDEGGGLSDPERSMLNGVGSMAGVDALGMGIEMKYSLLYLVKSRKGEWCLFDGVRHLNPDKYDSANGFKKRAIGDDEKIERVALLDLPAPAKGCQKIMFFAHPNASAEQVKDIHERLLSALGAMAR